MRGVSGIVGRCAGPTELSPADIAHDRITSHIRAAQPSMFGLGAKILWPLSNATPSADRAGSSLTLRGDHLSAASRYDHVLGVRIAGLIEAIGVGLDRHV